MARLLGWFSLLLLLLFGVMAFFTWRPQAAPTALEPVAQRLHDWIDKAAPGTGSSVRPARRDAPDDAATVIAKAPTVPAGSAQNIVTGNEASGGQDKDGAATDLPTVDMSRQGLVARVDVGESGGITIIPDESVPEDPAGAGVLNPSAVISEPTEPGLDQSPNPADGGASGESTAARIDDASRDKQPPDDELPELAAAGSGSSATDIEGAPTMLSPGAETTGTGSKAESRGESAAGVVRRAATAPASVEQAMSDATPNSARPASETGYGDGTPLIAKDAPRTPAEDAQQDASTGLAAAVVLSGAEAPEPGSERADAAIAAALAEQSQQQQERLAAISRQDEHEVAQPTQQQTPVVGDEMVADASGEFTESPGDGANGALHADANLASELAMAGRSDETDEAGAWVAVKPAGQGGAATAAAPGETDASNVLAGGPAGAPEEPSFATRALDNLQQAALRVAAAARQIIEPGQPDGSSPAEGGSESARATQEPLLAREMESGAGDAGEDQPVVLAEALRPTIASVDVAVEAQASDRVAAERVKSQSLSIPTPTEPDGGKPTASAESGDPGRETGSESLETADPAASALARAATDRLIAAATSPPAVAADARRVLGMIEANRQDEAPAQAPQVSLPQVPLNSQISSENRARLSMVLPPDAPQPEPAKSPEARAQAQQILDFLEGKVVEFQVGRDRLTDNGRLALDSLASLIQQHAGTHILVQGHTDSVGDHASNLELSGARALVARDYLVSAGVDEDRLSVQAFGETRPIATNRTEDGRRRNRRIDFAVSDAR